jgi:hypothetical protein
MNDNEINEKLNQCINKVINEIQKEPLIVNREIAIQSRLYRYLCEEIDEWNPKYNIFFNRYDVQNRISRVQMEFFGGEKRAIDLVILDKRDMQNMELFSFEKQSGKHILLSHAVEIKAELFAEWGEVKRRNQLYYDIEKLKDIGKKGTKYLHLIYICRRATKSRRIQKNIMDLIQEIKHKCGNKIEFHTNKPELYFYPYNNLILK